MDVNRLMVDERNKLMKEGRCFKCRNMGHRANECPEDDDNKKKGKEVPKKRMNGKELYAHIRALFKEITEEDRGEFLKGAKEAGFKEENCLDVSISLSQCLFCNNSQYLSKFNLCSNQYWLE
jgi:hypothetical protein